MNETKLIDREVVLRFFDKVEHDPTEGCWLWMACKSDGYGQFSVDGRMWASHKWSYEQIHGPVPKGLVLDHLVCDDRACCNPEHLLPSTNPDNILRGNGPAAINARKTHCIRGHKFTPENTYINSTGNRKCRECRRAHARAFQARKRATSN